MVTGAIPVSGRTPNRDACTMFFSVTLYCSPFFYCYSVPLLYTILLRRFSICTVRWCRIWYQVTVKRNGVE